MDAARGGGAAREPLSGLDAALAALLCALAFLLYRHTAPAQVNLDGLGYLKQLAWNVNAGHLLYLPLVRVATALRHGDALDGARLLGAASAAAAVALSYACARAFEGRRSALLFASGLLVSYAVWVQGSDVECYAPALLALLILAALLLSARALPGVESTAAVGLALGLAVLVHITHVLAVPLVVVALRAAHAGRGRGAGLLHAAAACLVGGAVALGAYAYEAFAVRHTDAAGLVRFLVTAQHGFAYEGTLGERLVDAIYGLCRALVHSPYLHESDARALLGRVLLGLAALAVLVGAAVRARRGLTHLPAPALVAWSAPYVVMALAFFGSDHERWLFVLPPLWLVGAAALGRSRRGAVVGALLVAGIAAANWRGAIGPAMDYTWDQTRADAATEPMRDGDLVVFPGHGWDEYVGFHSGRKVVPLPLVYYAGVLGAAGCEARLLADVRAARARGARVWAVRLPVGGEPAPGERDEGGLVELARLGLDRAALGRLLSRFALTPVATSQPSVTVLRLDERGHEPR